MLGLFVSLWLGAAPPVTDGLAPPAPSTSTSTSTSTSNDAQSTSTPIEGPLRAQVDPPASVDSPAPVDTPPLPSRKGKNLLIGAGVAYSLGAGIQWLTVGANGMLAGARPNGTSGLTLGMTLGGIGMVEGAVLSGIGSTFVAKASRGKDHLAKPMLAGGASLAGLGGGLIVATALMWPSIRAKCPIGVGCNLAALQVGGGLVSVGMGMIGYGGVLRRRDPDYRALSKQARTPLIVGSVMLVTSYTLSAALGLRGWQDDPGDALARRTRDRMLIPVVGPWIHAAGPDAPLFMAMVTGGLGAAQIGGAIALAVGAARAGSERARPREQRGVQISVVPRFDGVSLVGKF